MKKLLIYFIIICIITLSGCSRFSLDERSIIEGIAIDIHDDGILVTTQVYKQSGNQNETEKYEIHEAIGNTVYDALQNISHISGKRPFYSYNKIIIISYDALKDGLYNVLDYFIRDNEIRHNTLVCCSIGKAGDMLKIKNEGQLMPAERITTLLGIAGIPSYKTASGELLDVGTRMQDECTDVYLPCLKLIETNEGKIAYSEGSVAFSKDKPIYNLSPEEQLAFCYINGYETHYPLTVEYNTAKLVFSLKDINKDIKVSKNGNNGFDFNIKFNINTILEEVYSSGKKYDDAEIKQISNLLGEKICKMSNLATTNVLLKYKSDIFQYGAHVRQRFPKEYSNLSSWHNIISNCTFNFTHEVTLSRVGENNL